MAVTADDLKAYVADDALTADDVQITSALSTAEALVKVHVGAATVPSEITDRAVLEVASELFHRKNAPNGISQFQDFNAAPVRVARDPMVAAYPLLAPFVPPVVA